MDGASVVNGRRELRVMILVGTSRLIMESCLFFFYKIKKCSEAVPQIVYIAWLCYIISMDQTWRDLLVRVLATNTLGLITHGEI